MTVPSTNPRPIVALWSGDNPRALADRPIAFAHHTRDGWSVSLIGGAPLLRPTLDDVMDTVGELTGVHRLLLEWTRS